MAEPIVNNLETSSQNTNSSEENTDQQVTDLGTHYTQFAVNVDLVHKNITKEAPSYDRKFREQFLKVFNTKAELSIQTNLELEQTSALQEEMGKKSDELNQKTNVICENLKDLRKEENREKKQAVLFSNREEMLSYIVSKLMTIKTEEIIPDDEITQSFN